MPEDMKGPQKGILGGGSAVFGIRVAQAGTAYLSQVALARWMGVEEYGRYAFVWVWAVLFGSFAGMGTPVAVLRFIPAYLAKGDWAHVRGMFRWSISAVLVAGAALALVGSLVAFTIAEDLRTPLLFAFLAVPWLALGSTLASVGWAFGWQVLTYAPQALVANLGLILLAFWGGVFGQSLRATEIVAISGALAFLVIGVQTWALARKLPSEFHDTMPALEKSEWLRVAVPLLLASGFYMALDRTDLLLVGILTSETDAGIYAAASRTAALVALVLFSVTAATAARISTLQSQGRSVELSKYIRAITHRIFWISVVLAAALMTFAPSILALFGNAFLEGHRTLLVLSISHLFAAGAGPVGFLLTVSGNEVAFAAILGAGAILNVVLNLTLIPVWGLVGAATGTAISSAAWNICAIIVARRRLGFGGPF